MANPMQGKSGEQSPLKLGINGLGRIGKLTLWHHVARGHFSGIVVNIGREAGNDIHLDDTQVSRQHARIEFDGINFAISVNPHADLLQAFIMELSPTHGYRTISVQITKLVTLVGDYRTEVMSIPVFIENVLQNHFNCLGVLVVAFIATFVASYVLFTRSDVA